MKTKELKYCSCRTKLQKEMVGKKGFPFCLSCDKCGQDIHCNSCKQTYKNRLETNKEKSKCDHNSFPCFSSGACKLKPMETNQQEIRKEWLKSSEAKFYSPRGNKVIIDWWLEKLDLAVANKEKEIVEMIKEVKDEYRNDEDAFNNGLQAMKQDILSLITKEK